MGPRSNHSIDCDAVFSLLAGVRVCFFNPQRGRDVIGAVTEGKKTSGKITWMRRLAAWSGCECNEETIGKTIVAAVQRKAITVCLGEKKQNVMNKCSVCEGDSASARLI